MCTEIIHLLQKLKYSNGNVRYMILKNIAALIQYATRNDLLFLLDVMNATRDIELQIHMFSVCCIYLLSNDENIDIFITCNLIYASMENILSKHLPHKTSIVLNFLTLLLHEDREVFATRKLNLVTHARNMIRTSGCLAAMTVFFIRGMMYQDTWKALCQCLAETCCNCEINQSYCTLLIPKCIQVCSKGNLDVPPLLFNLLRNHERNIQMFIETNGMSLFSRNLLQYCPYLQLLDTVVQISAPAVEIAQKSGIFVNIHEILKLHGPYSRMGQWATAILFHADSFMKGNKPINENIENEVANDTNKSPLSMDHKPDCDSTTQLFHNIIKEIVQWQPTTDIAHTNSITIYNKTKNYKVINNIGNVRKAFDNHQQFQKSMNECNVIGSTFQLKTKSQENSGDLTFSFLQEWNEHSVFNKEISFAAKETTKQINSNDSLYNFNQKNHRVDTSLDTTRQRSIFHVKNTQDDISIRSIKHFQPVLMSTPKKKINRYKEKARDNTRHEFTMLKNNARRTNKFNSNKKQKPILNKELKNKSFSFRLFSAINDSCINVFSKVKNIFKSNKDSSKTKSAISHSKSNVKQEGLCNYSFTKYMNERDARLIGKRNWSKHNLSRKNISDVTQLCNTCDDTKELKEKMKNNKYLKHTIQKLTLGINLYGCDFKKISVVMWPQEFYMTPKVLYNLYRKLIRK